MLFNSKPQDFDVPPEQINDLNKPMWDKAMKELQKIAKFKTPSLKLKYLLNGWMITNNSFSLFGSVKDNQAASAEDILKILPYIIVKSQADTLPLQIKFIRMFQYNDLVIGEKDCVLTTVEISNRFISEKTIAEERLQEMNALQFEATLEKFNKMEDQEQE